MKIEGWANHCNDLFFEELEARGVRNCVEGIRIQVDGLGPCQHPGTLTPVGSVLRAVKVAGGFLIVVRVVRRVANGDPLTPLTLAQLKPRQCH